MIERPLLETERLILRPFELTDAPAVQRLAGERAIADTTLNIPHPYADGLAEEWISGHQKNFDEGKGVNWAITLRSDRKLIGCISLMGMVPGHQTELGYWIGNPYWGNGYCTEAGKSVLSYAFKELGLRRVHACFFERNPASGRVMQKLGMRHEGCRRSHVVKWGEPENLVLYGILKEKWATSE